MVVKSAVTSAVRNRFGSPISYSSCSVTPATDTRPPVPVVFRDDESAVGFGFENRIADTGEIGDALPVRLAIAAGALGSAFDGVARDRARREQIPIVHGPTELVNLGGHRHRRIRATPRDHDLRTLPQSLHHGSRAEIRIRTLHTLANGGERFARVHVLHLDTAGNQLVQPGEDIVALHHADSQASRAPMRPRIASRQPSGLTPPAFAIT